MATQSPQCRVEPLSAPARTLRWVFPLFVAVLVGCTLPRRDAPPGFFSSAAPVGFSANVRVLSTDRARVQSRMEIVLAGLSARARQREIRILALSGGGAGGAFGAGALVGLSRLRARPAYDVVTGVSTGALIAPFAFLGPEWDSQLTEAFTSGRGNSMSIHGLLQVLSGTGRRSAALLALVDHYVTDELVQAVAKEAASGRLLLVATTDVDKEEPVIWDMGMIAAHGGADSRKLFRDVLIASASIPGVFAPVLIHVEDGGVPYDEMHVDGNTSTSLFIVPTAAYFALFDPKSLEGARVYVLVNGQILEAPHTTRFNMPTVVARSFAAALRHMSRAQIIALSEFADKYRMSVNLSYLPYDHPSYSAADFRGSRMRTLFDYGERCAEQGHLWTTIDQTMTAIVAAPPGSPKPQSYQQLECPLREHDAARVEAQATVLK